MSPEQPEHPAVSAIAAPPRRRPGGRSARVRAAAIAATLEILTESGPMGLTVTDVAARAGINPVSIYRRWGTKEGLVLDALAQRFDQAVPIPDTGSLRDDLIIYATLFSRFLTAPLGQALAHTTPASLTPEFAAARRTMFAMQVERASLMIQRAIERGEIAPPVNSAAAIEAIVGPLLVRAMIAATVDETVAETLARFVVAGLAGPSCQAPHRTRD